MHVRTKTPRKDVQPFQAPPPIPPPPPWTTGGCRRPPLPRGTHTGGGEVDASVTQPRQKPPPALPPPFTGCLALERRCLGGLLRSPLVCKSRRARFSEGRPGVRRGRTAREAPPFFPPLEPPAGAREARKESGAEVSGRGSRAEEGRSRAGSFHGAPLCKQGGGQRAPAGERGGESQALLSSVAQHPLWWFPAPLRPGGRSCPWRTGYAAFSSGAQGLQPRRCLGVFLCQAVQGQNCRLARNA